MKAYLYQLFHVADQERIDEKTMLARIALSVCVILLCLTANVVSAYAYFTYTITSGSNTITAAQFDVEVEAPTGVQALSGKQEGYLLDNRTGAEQVGYAFKINKAGTASVGYAKIEVVTDMNDLEDGDETNDAQKFFTLPIGTYLDGGNQEEESSRNVTIIVPAGQTATVTFVAEWGSCSQASIEENGQIVPAYGIVTAVESVTGEEDPVQQPTTESQESAAQQPTTESQESAAQEPTTESQESAAQQPTTESQEDAAQQPTTESQESAAQQPTSESQEQETTEDVAQQSISESQEQAAEPQQQASSQEEETNES